MKIETMVVLTNTKGNSDLYSLFCKAAKGDFVNDLSDKTAVLHLEHSVSKAFDKFAQEMFEAGMKYQKEMGE